MIASASLSGDTGMTSAEFGAVAAILHREARISLSEAKVSLVQSRLARRLRSCGMADFGAYLRLVAEDEEERAAMVSALTTNHTSFFREAHHLDHLREVALPLLRTKAGRGEAVRLWSAGCSSGEEPYSIAMTLAGTSASEAEWLRGDVRLLATDLSEPMVRATRRATYSFLAADNVPLPYRAAWLREEGGNVHVAEQLRALVTARQLNLFEPWPFSRRFDVIFCRNVMIYFDGDAQADLEQRLVERLNPGGFLYIGHSERLAGAAAEATTCCGQTIYRKKD